MTQVTAIFDDQAQAEEAVSALRGLKVPDAQLSVITRRRDEVEVTSAKHADSAGERVGKGAIAGAGIGAIFGLAAVLIPGVGPFITAGAFASTLGATGGAAAAGAIVGGTSGAIAGALARVGYSSDEVRYYGPAIEQGAVLVAADADAGSESAVRSVLAQYGGRTYNQSTADRDGTREEEYRGP